MVISGQLEQEEDRPKWLLELENRKRKPRLAHEVGAGAPCIKCNAGCPGLDLHFWRKICKNCKCGRDDHDVPDDEFPQFDLLFGPTGKSKRKLIVLKVKDQQTDETFEWAPDTTKELAADYMKALPEDKLPIKGSAGAALRKQQLQKQLPLHDIDHKLCDELTESERAQFEEYLENLKKYAGQGKVLKVMAAKPFDKSLMTPANASECFSPKHRPTVATGQPLNLRTPSSFVPKSNYSTPLGIQEGMFHSNHGQTPLSGDLAAIARSLTAKSNYSTPLGHWNHPENASPALTDSYSPNSVYSTPLGQNREYPQPQPVPNSMNADLKSVSSRLENIRRPLFGQSIDEAAKLARYHHALANVKNEGEIADSHSVPGIHNLPMKFLDERYSSNPQPNNHDDQSRCVEMSSNIPEANLCNSILPNSSQNSAVHFAQSNLHDNAALKSPPYQPTLQRLKTLQTESSSIEKVPHDSPQWQSALQDENSRLADKMLCEALLPPSAIHSSDIIGSTLDEKGLSRIREKLSAKYNAKEEPVDLANALKSRDLARASSESKTNAINQNCDTIISNPCSKPISAQFDRYRDPQNTIIMSENLQNPVFPEEAVGTPIIFENHMAERLGSAMESLAMSPAKAQRCHECKESISIGDVVVTAEKAKDAAWHPGCFVCSACNELLVDLVYFYYKNKLYCGRDLAVLLEIPRCFACDELIFVREYTVAEGHNYHVKHFCCWDCDMPLAGQQYISENDRPLCLPCYQKTYAKSCSTCQKIIAADQQGVAVKNLNFHASDECFCCASCKKSLLNGKMAIKEDKPFCSKECIALYLNQNKK